MRKKTRLAVALALMSTGALASLPTSYAADNFAGTPAPKATIVLVHGAFSDASSWNKITPILLSRGYHVEAVQNPLTSLADDVAATRRAIANAPGDVVLVGHSWAGTVITEAGNDPKVKALVYVAAFAPDSGQSTADLVKNYPAAPGSSQIINSDGYLHLSPQGVSQDFAQDLSADEVNLIKVNQAPIKASSFQDKVTTAAWHTKPSWFVISANDRMINPQLERDMASKINAQTKLVYTGHLAMLADYKGVVREIMKAAHNTIDK